MAREPIVIQIEVTLEEWAQKAIEEDRGAEQPSTPSDMYWVVEDAIARRFGGEVHAKWLNNPEAKPEDPG